MDLLTLIKKSRSIRRFKENVPVSRRQLLQLIEMARRIPSAQNAQPLKYFVSFEKKINDLIFPNLAWAGFLEDWNGPAHEEQPAAYIVVLGDSGLSGSLECDAGIAMQTILLGAASLRLGGCIIKSVNREVLKTIINPDTSLDILYVIALGFPDEKIVLEELKPGGNTRYWRDEQGVHHVPKRSLKDLILNYDKINDK